MTGKRPGNRNKLLKKIGAMPPIFLFYKVHKKQTSFSTTTFEIYPHWGIDFFGDLRYNYLVSLYILIILAFSV
jgi:hypothetical protein